MCALLSALSNERLLLKDTQRCSWMPTAVFVDRGHFTTHADPDGEPTVVVRVVYVCMYVCMYVCILREAR